MMQLLKRLFSRARPASGGVVAPAPPPAEPPRCREAVMSKAQVETTLRQHVDNANVRVFHFGDVIGPQWHALPGGRLELGSTGFAIVLGTDTRSMPYTAFDPDGRTLGYGAQLQLMKQLLEQQARDRAEFAALPPTPPLPRSCK